MTHKALYLLILLFIVSAKNITAQSTSNGLKTNEANDLDIKFESKLLQRKNLIIIDNLFRLGFADLTPDSAQVKLDPIVQYLKKQQEIKLQITCKGFNKPWSSSIMPLKRAENLKKYFVQKGIISNRITCKGKLMEETPINQQTKKEMICAEFFLFTDNH